MGCCIGYSGSFSVTEEFGQSSQEGKGKST